MPSTTIVLPYRAAGVVLGSAAGAQSIVTTGRVIGTSAELSTLLLSYAPGGTAGNINKATAQGVALVQALIFGGK